MTQNGYIIFHLNLAFSSIEESKWREVIGKCYWPILDIIKELDIPIGIELSAWTLLRIQETDPDWITAFKSLLKKNKCELLGSGYCQIIAPLVPYVINLKNLKIALSCYRNILDVKPKIAFVNELAFSNSVVDLLVELDFSALVMERDNINLALKNKKQDLNSITALATGNSGTALPVLWADSMLFQKFQQVVHGDISLRDYEKYVKKRLSNENLSLAIYCNDAETFDFRPGRFAEERSFNPMGEWKAIARVLTSLRKNLKMNYLLPSDAIYQDSLTLPMQEINLSSGCYPIPVKKQPKYNISRWAVTGRDDTWINTMCYRIYQYLEENRCKDSKAWEELCEFWSSDFRTHITDLRWKKLNKRIAKVLQKYRITSNYVKLDVNREDFIPLSPSIKHQKFSIVDIEPGIYVGIETESIKVVFNLRRGMVIEKLAFKAQEFRTSIGTLKQGFFKDISRGADFYSGGVIIELPEKRQKITDLQPVEVKASVNKNGNLELLVEIETSIGKIEKIIEIFLYEEKVKISYYLSGMKENIASIRLGNFTLSPEFSKSLVSYACNTGGNFKTEFDVDGTIHQSQSASSFVSSSRGFCSTSGELFIKGSIDSLAITWDPFNCVPLCFLDHDNEYTRIIFSLNEVDDTSTKKDLSGSLSLAIAPLTNTKH